jgi:hypothetical protein
LTLQDLGNLGEFVAAIATVLTLVYLASQIRQNTTTVRANSHHAGSTAWSELMAAMAADADVANLYFRGRFEPGSLSREESHRFDLLVDAVLAQVENFHHQYESGQLAQTNQDRFARLLDALFESPGMRAYWGRRRAYFTDEFVRYVEFELGLPAGPAEGSG